MRDAGCGDGERRRRSGEPSPFWHVGESFSHATVYVLLSRTTPSLEDAKGGEENPAGTPQ